MNQKIKQIANVFVIYLIGYFLTYPLNIILYFTWQHNTWYFVLCGMLFICGILSWFITHFKTSSFQKFSFKNITEDAYRDFYSQLIGVFVMFVISVCIELFHLYQPGMRYYNFLSLFVDREMALDLSTSALLDPSTLCFIAISFYWGSYYISKILFDTRIRIDNKRTS